MAPPYEDDVGVVMKGCEQLNHVYSWKEFNLKPDLNTVILDQLDQLANTYGK